MRHFRDQLDPFGGDWVVKNRQGSQIEEFKEMLTRNQRMMEDKVRNLSGITYRLEVMRRQQDATIAEIQEIKSILNAIVVDSGPRRNSRVGKDSIPQRMLSGSQNSHQSIRPPGMVSESPYSVGDEPQRIVPGSPSSNSRTLNAPEAFCVDGIASSSTQNMDIAFDESFKQLSDATLELYEVIPHNEANERSVTEFLSSVQKCIDVYSV